jgi:hypothetical protein
MRRRTAHAALRRAASGGLELPSKQLNLLFVFLLESHMRLLHAVNFLPNELHLVDLGLDCHSISRPFVRFQDCHGKGRV